MSFDVDAAFLDSSIRANQSVNSSSPGADAVEATECSRRMVGRARLKGLLKRGDELRAGCLPAAIDEAADEDCRDREWRVYEPSSEERSREDSERFGPGWKESDWARDSVGGSGSWKRTVRLGLPVVVVEEDMMDVRPEERMEDWSVWV